MTGPNLLPAFAAGDGLRVFPIIGDRMEPKLRRGDFLLVQPLERWSGAGLYVLDGPFGPDVHRVDVAGGNVRLIPDNPRYNTFDVTREQFHAEVLGKAVFKVNVTDWCLVPDQLRV
jgi:SOS-response transcriptional repressor LexA